MRQRQYLVNNSKLRDLTIECSSNANASDGYTMLEMLVVLMIVTLSVAIAIPRFVLLQTANVRMDVAGVISDLRMSRDDAIYSGVETSLKLAPNGYLLEPSKITRRFRSEAKLSIFAPLRWDDRQESDIVFYPDGSSSGGRVTVEHSLMKAVINVNRLSGYIEPAP